MLTVQYIRENKDEVIERLSIKNFTNIALIDEVLQLDEQRRISQKEHDDMLAETNALAREIGQLFKDGKASEAENLKQRNTTIKDRAKLLAEQLENTKNQLQSRLVEIPNLPHLSVPRGRTPNENLRVQEEGSMPDLPANAVPHWDLITRYSLIDFDLGNKVTGAGFPFYTGKGARLQRALINFFLDEAVAAGYQEVQPPLLVNEASAYGTLSENFQTSWKV